MWRSGTGWSGMRAGYALPAVMIMLSLLGGCATFRSSKQLDAGPFAENVTVLVGDVTSDLVNRKPFYIARYLEGPTLEAYRQEWSALHKVLRGIVLYSTQVVNVAQAPMKEEKKPKELARYVRELVTPVIGSKDPDLRITQDFLDLILRDIEQQNTMLGALRAAQPLIDKTVTYVDGSFDRINYLLNTLVQEVNMKMDERWAGTRDNVQSLLELQNRTVKSYVLLYRFREGDPGGLDALRSNDRALEPFISRTGPLGEKELDAVEERLMARLKNLKELGEQLSPQIQQYLSEARERDELLYLNQQAGKKLRTTILLWARSHRNLAAGISVPPEIDLYNVLVGSAKKALPVP